MQLPDFITTPRTLIVYSIVRSIERALDWNTVRHTSQPRHRVKFHEVLDMCEMQYNFRVPLHFAFCVFKLRFNAGMEKCFLFKPTSPANKKKINKFN